MLQPTEYLGRDRVAFTGTDADIPKGVKMTYTAMASSASKTHLTCAAANIAVSSDGDGTTSAVA